MFVSAAWLPNNSTPQSNSRTEPNRLVCKKVVELVLAAFFNEKKEGTGRVHLAHGTKARKTFCTLPDGSKKSLVTTQGPKKDMGKNSTTNNKQFQKEQ